MRAFMGRGGHSGGRPVWCGDGLWGDFSSCVTESHRHLGREHRDVLAVSRPPISSHNARFRSPITTRLGLLCVIRSRSAALYGRTFVAKRR